MSRLATALWVINIFLDTAGHLLFKAAADANAAFRGMMSRFEESGLAKMAKDAVDRMDAINGPLALRASKTILARAQDWSSDEAWTLQGEIAGPVMGSEDAQEGSIAFAEKRDPVWKGR